ncbi:MAG TPA: superinfection immunity protein [Candidatus Acidoferrales bacterium]|nr:superinfection immunity protein [Candidatus Acidoferrales bacterium]
MASLTSLQDRANAKKGTIAVLIVAGFIIFGLAVGAGAGKGLAGFVVVIGIGALYFLPTIVGRHKQNLRAIFALNLLLGWTLVGWVVALVWALTKDQRGAAIVGILIAIGCVPAAHAKPRTKVYPMACDKVWRAVEKIADSKQFYTSSMLDDKRMKAEFVTGHGNWTGKRTLYLELSPANEGCQAALEGVFSGIIHDDKGDLFTRLDDALGIPRPPEKPPYDEWGRPTH